MASSPPYGYAARRNGSCLIGEVDCDTDWGNIQVCSPMGLTAAMGASAVRTRLAVRLISMPMLTIW